MQATKALAEIAAAKTQEAAAAAAKATKDFADSASVGGCKLSE